MSTRLAFDLPAGFKELRVAEERLSVDGEHVYTRDRSSSNVLQDSAPTKKQNS